MITYIKKLVESFLTDHNTSNPLEYKNQLTGIVEELERLDPRDFPPDVRHDLVQIRSRMKGVCRYEGPATIGKGNLTRLLEILDAYTGEGSRAVIKSFPFVSDPKLQRIIESDYKELAVKLFPSGAWKSSVVMAGSILEAILYDLLTSTEDIRIRAISSSKAPRNKSGNVLDLEKDDWKLQSLIDVAADIGAIPRERSATFDQVLRDYRNFIHPRKELRAEHPCSEAEALMAKGALDGIYNHLKDSGCGPTSNTQ